MIAFLVFADHRGYPDRSITSCGTVPPWRIEYLVSPPFSHLSADFVGALPSQLGDTSLISGLLVASAGAAGITTIGAPVVRKLPGDAISVVLLVNDGHMTVHTFPPHHLLLLDILTATPHDSQKALDVFKRRLTASEVRCETRARG